MTRRGFALLAVLWVLTALAGLAGVGMLIARVGSETTRNRALLARAEWAREACEEILAARFAADPTIRRLGPVELGRGAWCRASIDDPASRVNINTADPSILVTLLRSVGIPPAQADSMITVRTGTTIYDLRALPGIDSLTGLRLGTVLTVRGSGAINVNGAPPEVLRVLPGMTEESVGIIVSRRFTRPIQNADQLVGALSRSARTILLGSYAEFVRTAVFTAPQLTVIVEGGITGTPISARATLTAVPVPGRLAIIRRETE